MERIICVCDDCGMVFDADMDEVIQICPRCESYEIRELEV